MPCFRMDDPSAFEAFKYSILEIPDPGAKYNVENAINAVKDVEELFEVIDKKLESIIKEPHHRIRKYKNYPKAPAIRARAEWQSLRDEFHHIMRGAAAFLVEQIDILELVVETFGPELKDPNTSMETKIERLRSINKVLKDHAINESYSLDMLATKIKRFSEFHFSTVNLEEDKEDCVQKLVELENEVKSLRRQLTQALGIAIGCDLAAGALFAIGFLVCPGALPALIGIIPYAVKESQAAADKFWSLMEARFDRDEIKKDIKSREKDGKELQRLIKGSTVQFSRMVISMSIISRLWTYIARDISKIEGECGKIKLLSDANYVDKLQEEIDVTWRLYGILLSILKAYREGVNIIIPERFEMEQNAKPTAYYR